MGWPADRYFTEIAWGARGVDIKVPWELSRCAHFVTLGQAYALTGDESYTRAFSDQIEDWIRRKFVNKPGPMEAVWLSVKQNVSSSGLIFKTLAGLFTGSTSVRQLQRPVGIAQLSGESAQAGWVALLSLMAMISLNLGLLNLMPVPVLDGGHILIMALEGVARRDFSMQVKEKMLLAGFLVLMVLMVTVIYNDLTRISWIENLMPWRN